MSDTPSVVVLRPGDAGRELAGSIESLPLPCICSPMFRIADVEPSALRNQFGAAGPFDGLILTSPHAAAVALSVLGRDTLAPLFRVAPGRGTAGVLEAVGLPVCRPGLGGTSEDILALPELAAERVRGRRFGILAAPGGRTLLRETLTERGARVEMITAYRRVGLAPSDALIEALDRRERLITLVSSRAGLDRLVDQLGSEARIRHLLAQRFIVSSKRLAAVLRELGATDVANAQGAADQDMIRALRRMCRIAPRAPELGQFR